MVKGSCSVYLFTVILLIVVLVSPSISPAPPDSACDEWRRVPELQGRSVNGVLVHASAVFVATDAGVFKSEDGLNWHQTSLRLSTYSLASFQGELLAGTEDGVYISMDGGVSWRAIGLKGRRVTALAVSGNVIYAGTDGGVYRKEGEGDWKATSLTEPIKSLAADPANPNIVYAGTGGGVPGKTWGDLYLSANGGSTWSQAWLSNATFLALLAMGVPLYYEVTCITINPCNPQEVFAGTFAIFTVLVVVPMKAGALYVSRDHGGSWEGIGPDLKCVFAVRVSRDCRSLILGTDNGVYISEDGGRSWYHLGPANETVRAVESRGTEIYAGTASGLLVYHRRTYPTKVSLRVEPSWIPALAVTPRVRLSGNLTSLGEGLSGRTLKMLLNGVETESCPTNIKGGYECTVAWPSIRVKTVNLTVLYPGDLCYEASSVSQLFYLVNVSTAYGVANGAGWYRRGSNATVSIAPTTGIVDCTKYVFKGWRVKGSLVSTEPSFTFTVREPVELEIVWEISIVAAETRMSLRVQPLWIPLTGGEVRLSGNLTSLGEGLSGRTLKMLLNGVEAGFCRTGEYGDYECALEWPTTGARTVNLTMLYPGDSCYKASWASRRFHLINATTAHGKVEGAGWYLEGSSATISVAPTVVSEGLTEYVFKGWRVKGVIISTEPVLVLMVGEPMEIEAVWERRLSIVALTVVAAVVVVVTASLLLVVILLVRERRRA